MEAIDLSLPNRYKKENYNMDKKEEGEEGSEVGAGEEKEMDSPQEEVVERE